MVYQEWKSMEGNDVVATSPFSGKVFDFIPLGGRVLDIGCGNGRISKKIIERGYQTYGIDVNESAVLLAQKNQNLFGAKFSVQDATHTDFPDNFFGGVVEQAVLACMDRSERIAAFKEIYRIVKPGGVVSIAEFGIRPEKKDKYEVDATITGEYGTRIVKREDGSEWFRSHNFSEEELEILIVDAGFEIVAEEHPDFQSFKGNPHPGHQYVAKKIEIMMSPTLNKSYTP